MVRGLAAVLALGLGVGVSAGGDDELEMHLESLRPRLEDPRRDLDERERLALEMAATLDRAAQAEASPEGARARWGQAGALLERFNPKNPGHPRATLFAVQAAVYLWAEAQGALRQYELAPADQATRS